MGRGLRELVGEGYYTHIKEEPIPNKVHQSTLYPTSLLASNFYFVSFICSLFQICFGLYVHHKKVHLFFLLLELYFNNIISFRTI